MPPERPVTRSGDGRLIRRKVLGDDAEVELWVYIGTRKARFGFLKLGDLRAAAAALEELGDE